MRNQNQQEKSTLLDIFLTFKLFEKCLFIIMCLTSSALLIFLLMISSPHVHWAKQALIIDVIIFTVSYFTFRFSVQRRTGEKVSIKLSPKFHW